LPIAGSERSEPENAVIDVVVPRSGRVRLAGVAVFEVRIPYPDIERVEVPKRHAACYFAKTAIADAGFREPPALEAAMDAVLDVHERVIGIFIADIEVGSRAYNFNVVWVKTIDPRD